MFIFILGWLDAYVPELVMGPFTLFSKPGYPRGLYSGLVWLAIVAAVMVCARGLDRDPKRMDP